MGALQNALIVWPFLVCQYVLRKSMKLRTRRESRVNCDKFLLKGRKMEMKAKNPESLYKS